MGDPSQLRPKPWKPGQSGNPKGRPKLPEGVKNLTAKDYRAKLYRLFQSTESQIRKWAEDPTTPALDRWLITILLKGRKDGDAHRLEMLLNRVHGKVKDVVELEGSMNTNTRIDISKIPTDKLKQLKQILKEAEVADTSDTDTDRPGAGEEGTD